ncbi:MAG TPA: RNA degradosome polyphosphate kinase, partial [Acidimicrobiaceae bacterium]|nr:RNA degradosome polyphosphate kinase [Acidimicrobiaceae bacterium]
VVGRFLEHSRVYRFGSAERGHTFLIGSADVMPRSLRHRVEALVPIIEQRAADRLTRIIDCYLADDIDRWTL